MAVPKQPPRDPLLQLVSLQKASGCWELDPALAAALGKTSEEVENTKPSAVSDTALIITETSINRFHDMCRSHIFDLGLFIVYFNCSVTSCGLDQWGLSVYFTFHLHARARERGTSDRMPDCTPQTNI